MIELKFHIRCEGEEMGVHIGHYKLLILQLHQVNLDKAVPYSRTWAAGKLLVEKS